MFWLEVVITAPAGYRRPVEKLIIEMGGSLQAATVKDGVSGVVTVTGYFPAKPYAGEFVHRIRTRVGNVLGTKPDIVFAEVHGRDPTTGRRRPCVGFRVGERFLIKPSWETCQPRHGEIVIDQDPTLAFGCGTHPTTVMALELLERLLVPGDRVIDVGTGSGILAVAAAKLGAGAVYAIDPDPVALEAARGMVAKNGLQGRISVIEGHLLNGLEVHCELMVANLYPHLLADLIPAAPPLMVPGGCLVVTGFTTDDGPAVAGRLRGAGFDVEKTETRDDWVVVAARRPQPAPMETGKDSACKPPPGASVRLW